MAKKMPDPATYAKRWVQGMQRTETQTKYKENIQSLDFNPLQRAAEASDAYIQGCQRGNNKRAAKLMAYGQQNWINACLNKGAARLGTGAAASQQRMQEAGAKLLTYISNGLNALPRGGSEAARQERMIAWSNYMKNYSVAG